MRILVIDDQQDMLNLMGAALADPRHEVHLEQDSRRAFTLLEDGKFDVLIVDIVMPNLGGIDVIKKVRSNHPDLWIVAVSGGGDSLPVNTNLKISEADGADRILYKPFRKSELLTAIARS